MISEFMLIVSLVTSTHVSALYMGHTEDFVPQGGIYSGGLS